MDYDEGAKKCFDNAVKLMTSADLIFKDKKGTDTFGTYLYGIAFEEMAKAIFCKFVALDWVTSDFIRLVFRDHKYKVPLFDSVFQSFEIKDSIPYLEGKHLGKIPLEDLFTNYNISRIEHRNEITDLLYVQPDNNNWHEPSTIQNIDTRKELLKSKISALGQFYQFLKNEVTGKISIDGLCIYSNLNKQSIMSWDSF